MNSPKPTLEPYDPADPDAITFDWDNELPLIEVRDGDKVSYIKRPAPIYRDDPRHPYYSAAAVS